MRELVIRGSGRPALLDDEDFERLSGFTWRITKLRRNGTQYVVRDERIEGKVRKFLLHREVLQAEPRALVDHRNRNGLDNQRANLRVVSDSENQQNKVGKAGSTSRFKGVSWDSVRGKWKAQIRQENLGRFESEEEAARAYDARARNLFGDFGLLNFP